ncbi:MAG: STAS domain-containing protein [bacterium]
MLRFTVDDTQMVNIVRVEGEVDITTAPSLNRALADALTHSHHVVADLTGVRYIDLSGIRALEAAHQVARQQGQLLVVITPPDPIGNIFEIVKFRQEIPIVRSQQAALEAIKRGGTSSAPSSP